MAFLLPISKIQNLSKESISSGLIEGHDRILSLYAFPTCTIDLCFFSSCALAILHPWSSGSNKQGFKIAEALPFV